MKDPTAPDTWRLFLGLWPPEGTRDAMVRHAGEWRWPDAARATRPERLHVTLHFIGPVARAAVDELRGRLATPVEPFTLLFDHAEVWRGGIAVLEALHPPTALRQLHAQLARALRAEELPLDERPWRPHVTLARDARGARPPTTFEPVAWHGDGSHALVRSLPGGQGYDILQQFG